MKKVFEFTLGYEVISEEVVKQAEKSFRQGNNRMYKDVEDLIQDLFVHMIKENPSTLQEARWKIKCKLTDIYRSDFRKSEHLSGYDLTREGETSEYSDDDSYMIIADTVRFDPYYEVSNDEIIENFKNLLNNCSERCRKYVISKLYLDRDGLDCFSEEFAEIFEGLTEEGKNIIRNSKRPSSDDTIAKSVLGLKSGTNAGSMRTMKKGELEELKMLLKDVLELA